jgi:hypothetical protein
MNLGVFLRVDMQNPLVDLNKMSTVLPRQYLQVVQPSVVPWPLLHLWDA